MTEKQVSKNDFAVSMAVVAVVSFVVVMLDLFVWRP